MKSERQNGCCCRMLIVLASGIRIMYLFSRYATVMSRGVISKVAIYVTLECFKIRIIFRTCALWFRCPCSIPLAGDGSSSSITRVTLERELCVHPERPDCFWSNWVRYSTGVWALCKNNKNSIPKRVSSSIECDVREVFWREMTGHREKCHYDHYSSVKTHSSPVLFYVPSNSLNPVST